MPRKLFNKTNRFIIKHRLLIFLVLLSVLLTVFPFIQEYAAAYVFLLELGFSLLLIAGIFIVSANRELLTITILLAILTITVIWFNYVLQNHRLLLFSLGLEILFFTVTTFVIISHVLAYKRVTADKIYGSICGYFLLGIIWALIYTLIESAMPGSFNFSTGYFISDQPAHLPHYTFLQFLYYSFITLTTLGYGDIVPVHAIARMMSSFEAIIGQLYLAVLISRLVGLHIVHHYRWP